MIRGWILFTAKVLLQDRGGVTDALERLNDHDVPARAEEFRISNFEFRISNEELRIEN
jgi:hypothetical protein